MSLAHSQLPYNESHYDEWGKERKELLCEILQTRWEKMNVFMLQQKFLIFVLSLTIFLLIMSEQTLKLFFSCLLNILFYTAFDREWNKIEIKQLTSFGDETSFILNYSPVFCGDRNARNVA